MDNESIRYFLYICELNNMTKAAEQLHISQPALSRRILALEDELGVKLLDRSSTGIRTTEAGRIFYDDARKLIRMEDTLKEKMEQFRTGFYGRLKIGYHAHDYFGPIVHAWKKMEENNPEIEIEFESMSHRAMIQRYIQGDLDIVYLFRGDIPMISGSIVVTILRNQGCALVPAGHRLHDRQEISVSELIGEQYVLFDNSRYKYKVTTEFEKTLEDHGISLRNALYLSDPNARFFEISSGKRIGLTGKYTNENLEPFSEYIRMVPLSDVDFEGADLCAVYHEENDKAERFINYLLEYEDE